VNDLQHTPDHEALNELLPWYVNDTLNDTERQLVRQHLHDCEACRGDVELLSRVQRGMRNDSPAPLVPAPRKDALLAALDAAARAGTRRRRWPLLAAAASILVAVAAAALWPVLRGTGVDPQRFHTATSAAGHDAINYVVELQFRPDVGAAQRNAVLESLGTNLLVVPVSERMYRITLGLGPVPLVDLERYVAGIESRPEIASARVVAVQLPVE